MKFAAILSPVLWLTFLQVRGQIPAGLQHSFPPPMGGAQASTRMGDSVAIDGDIIVMGVPSEDVDGKSASGVVKVFHAGTGAVLKVIYNPNNNQSDKFGASVAVSGTRLAVSAPGADTTVADSGRVYVYDLGGPTTVPAVLIRTINNPAPVASEGFNLPVAISGGRVAVGVPAKSVFGSSSGIVYLYDIDGATPGTPLSLFSPGAAEGDRFGQSVALSGSRLAVGCPGKDPGASNAGAAYVFDLGSGTPATPVATLNNPEPGIDDTFGNAVAISGTRVVVGARLDDPLYKNAGSAYVFDLAGPSPSTPVLSLHDPNEVPDLPPPGLIGHTFGHSVGISGTRIVVGAYLDDSTAGNSGRVYVYNLTHPSPSVPELIIENPSPAVSDQLGFAVAVLDDKVLAGAPGDDTLAPDVGGVYVYDMSGTPALGPVFLLNYSSTQSSDGFGYATALSGNLLAIGAPCAFELNPTPDVPGSVSIFNLAGANPAVPVAILTNPDPWLEDRFGSAVAIHGTRVAVGSSGDNTDGANTGRVFIYDIAGPNPAEPLLTISHPSPGAGGNFGQAVALAGDKLAVGAARHADGYTWSGVVYVYDLSVLLPEVPVLTIPNPAPGFSDGFARSLAISGNRMVVGHYTEALPPSGGGAPVTRAGAAYVYDLTSLTPQVHIRKLTDFYPTANHWFGYAVAIEGTRVIIGSPGSSNVGTANYIDLDGDRPHGWHILNPHPVNNANFGRSVAISGQTLLIGAPRDNGEAADAGRAYLFAISPSPTSGPALVDTLKNPSPTAGWFGNSVSMDGVNMLAGAPYDNAVRPLKGAAYLFTVLPDIGVLHNPGAITSGAYTASFPDTTDNAISAIPWFTIRNTGGVSLEISGVTITGSEAGDFHPDTANIPASIPVGGSATLPVTFVPTRPGLRAASLQIYSSDPDESPFIISLKGTGINIPPAFSHFTAFTPVNTPVTIPYAALLSRASDPDGGTLSVTSAVSVSANGAVISNSPGTASLTVTPRFNYKGLDAFSISIGDGQGSTVSGSVTLSTIPAPPDDAARLNTAFLSNIPGRGNSFLFFRPAGTLWRIQRSTNLSGWSNIGLLTAGPDGTVPFFDNDPPSTRAWYRAVAP